MPPGAPIPRQDESSESVWWATGLETPVFFDERGHRARLVRFIGACSSLLVVAWIVLVVSGPLGFGSLPAQRFLVPQGHHHHSLLFARGRVVHGTTEAVRDVPTAPQDPRS